MEQETRCSTWAWLERPIVGAPMAGGPSTPELVAAVSAAGGLGFLAAGYKTADQLAAQIQRVRELTSRPFGVNLFVVDPFEPDAQALDAYRRALAPEARRLGVQPGAPRWDDDHWDDKLTVVLDTKPDVVSFTFGCPGPATLARLSATGIQTMVTVTTVDEARIAASRGADALTVQGPKAGGHRATFDQTATPSQQPLPDLVEAIRARAGLPLVAGGGLATADDLADLAGLGAMAAQVGTALLLADEAGTNTVHRTALADPGFAATSLTRAFTGRAARGLTNRFMIEHADAPIGYPHLHHMTGPLRAAAVANNDPHVAHLWAGTAHALTQHGTATSIVESLTP